jgi:hypothetical protein
MDIQIHNVQLYGGKQELLSDATVKLVYGRGLHSSTSQLNLSRF